MFLFGLVCGAIALILVYEVIGRHSAINTNRRFFFTRPFLSALTLALLFLVLALLIDFFFVQKSEGSILPFLVDPKTYLAASKEFFFAFFIAIFIVATVELATKREQKQFLEEATHNAQKNVFNAVYKNRIDGAIFDEVEASVFDARFVRTRHNRSINLENIEGDQDYILMKSAQEFLIKNVTVDNQHYIPTVYCPKPLEKHADLSKVDRVSVYRSSGGHRRELVYEHTDGKISEFIIEDDDAPDELVYKFAPVKLEAGTEIEVCYSLQLAKEKYDNEIWTSLVPTLTAEVIVTCDVENLKIGAISLHRGLMSPIAAGVSNGMKRWAIREPILPYQGYVVTWSKAD